MEKAILQGRRMDQLICNKQGRNQDNIFEAKAWITKEIIIQNKKYGVNYTISKQNVTQSFMIYQNRTQCSSKGQKSIMIGFV